MTSPTRVILPPKRIWESKVFPFDFTSLCQVGDTLASVAVIVTVWSGVDPSPSAVFSALAIVGQIVNVTLQGGVVGVTYNVAVQAQASISGNIELDGFLTVIPQAA
jgi:hypothetical protein